MSKPVFIQNLSKAYENNWLVSPKPVLKNISLSIEFGNVVGFVGPNGAGKTTTIYCMLGILFPDRGSIQIFGNQAGTPTAKDKIGYQSEIFFPDSWMTSLEALRFYSSLSKKNKSNGDSRLYEVLELVGLEKEKNQKINTFSKGMKQRLGLAQALIHKPELLILDEPFTGLDPHGRKLVSNVIAEQKEKGTTIFFSSHILSDVEQLCDHVVIIRNGEIILSTEIKNVTEYENRFIILVSGWNDDYRNSLPVQVQIKKDNKRTIIECTEAEKDEVIRFCLDKNIDIRLIEQRKNTLEDIYMKLNTYDSG